MLHLFHHKTTHEIGHRDIAPFQHSTDWARNWILRTFRNYISDAIDSISFVASNTFVVMQSHAHDEWNGWEKFRMEIGALRWLVAANATSDVLRHPIDMQWKSKNYNFIAANVRQLATSNCTQCAQYTATVWCTVLSVLHTYTRWSNTRIDGALDSVYSVAVFAFLPFFAPSVSHCRSGTHSALNGLMKYECDQFRTCQYSYILVLLFQ